MTNPHRTFRTVALVAALFGVLATTVAHAAPVSTAFTYQGRLQMSGVSYTGTADFVFRLHDDLAAGTQVGADVSVAGVNVSDGFFTVELDFGPVFDGTALWLETEVMTPGDGGFTLLAPRTPLTAAPYALYALNGPAGGGGGQWLDVPNGIEYSAGNVGVGTAPGVDRKLWVDAGTANSNPLVVTNNNVNYAALAVRNFATNGYGFYDGGSTRHYVAGRWGIGTLNPGYSLDVYANLAPAGRFVSVGSTLTPGTHAALYVSGQTGGGLFGGVSDGIYSSSTDGRAVSGWSASSIGVSGDNTSAGTYGMLGTPNEGIYGFSPNALKPAARFNAVSGGVALEANGLAKVKTLQIMGGADLAERFDVAGAPEPGTVLAIDPTQPGRLEAADEAYSHRVAGVVSGANALDAGIVLAKDARVEGTAAVALTGRVWVKCDASEAPIAVGDLLTTSSRAGHAMKATDRERAHGAVLGKAMTALDLGTGLVLVLVSLQ